MTCWLLLEYNLSALYIISMESAKARSRAIWQGGRWGRWATYNEALHSTLKRWIGEIEHEKFFRPAQTKSLLALCSCLHRGPQATLYLLIRTDLVLTVHMNYLTHLSDRIKNAYRSWCKSCEISYLQSVCILSNLFLFILRCSNSWLLYEQANSAGAFNLGTKH